LISPDLKATDFSALIETIPTQLALVFFALLHVPINVPALALSVGEDNVQTDAELVNHGLSNFLAGCVGSIPNYLVYTNSVLFYRVGGTNRLSGFMLALVTLLVFLVGPWVIGYLPVMIVGTVRTFSAHIPIADFKCRHSSSTFLVTIS
jgi:SulP family sulfate permease